MRRGDRTPADWDGGEWVDVGRDGRWRPSAGQRLRALVVLLVAIGALAALAGLIASGNTGDDDDEVAASSTTESTTRTAPTTTEPIDPTSLDGAPAPEQCVFDDRGAAPLREPAAVAVRVLNGTPRGGHAGAISDDLEDAGYRMLEPSNADRLPVTRIEYQPGSCAEAVQLVEVLAIPGIEVGVVEPGSELATETPRADLIVTLGRDSL